MLLIEKVLLLKATDLFRDTPEPDLIDTAALLEELELEENTRVFSKGDMGSCMYIVCKGKVGMHDGDHILAVVGENDFFGELSLLDTETRSAGAVCLEDCFLLKLGQAPFYDILSNNSEVLKGILRTLVRRLRMLIEKSAAMSTAKISHTTPLSP